MLFAEPDKLASDWTYPLQARIADTRWQRVEILSFFLLEGMGNLADLRLHYVDNLGSTFSSNLTILEVRCSVHAHPAFVRLDAC